MAAKTRIYLAEMEGKTYLVDTSSVGQARTVVAKRHINVRLATSSEVVKHMRSKTAEYIHSTDDGQMDVEEVAPPGEPPLTFGGAQNPPTTG